MAWTGTEAQRFVVRLARVSLDGLHDPHTILVAGEDAMLRELSLAHATTPSRYGAERMALRSDLLDLVRPRQRIAGERGSSQPGMAGRSRRRSTRPATSPSSFGASRTAPFATCWVGGPTEAQRA